MGEVEPERHSTLLCQMDGPLQLVITVVPAEHDVLPHDPDPGASGATMEAFEVAERDIEVTANSVSAIALSIAAVDGEDDPVEQAFSDDRLFDASRRSRSPRRCSASPL
jgi:hypothetical protein